MIQILIGGSASTGSSLLKTILGRHKEIFAGSETSLFTKKELYEDFNHFKSRVLKRFPQGLRSHSYHMYNGVDLDQAEYGWTETEIKQLLNDAESFPVFADSFFSRGIKQFHKKHWVEKTPGNAFLFNEFLHTFPEGKVLHITRNPVDTIYSLIRRGYNLLEACGIYILNTSAALRAKTNSNYYELKYEDILSDGPGSIRSLMAFLGLKFDENTLSSGNPYGIKKTKIKSWSHDETDSIQPNKKDIPENTQINILMGLNCIKISEAGKTYFNLSIDNFADLLDIIGYDVDLLPASRGNLHMIRSQIRNDKWNRIRKFYPTGIHYPLSIQR